MFGFIPPPIVKNTDTIKKNSNNQNNIKEHDFPRPLNPVLILISIICLFCITFLSISS